MNASLPTYGCSGCRMGPSATLVPPLPGIIQLGQKVAWGVKNSTRRLGGPPAWAWACSSGTNGASAALAPSDASTARRESGRDWAVDMRSPQFTRHWKASDVTMLCNSAFRSCPEASKARATAETVQASAGASIRASA